MSPAPVSESPASEERKRENAFADFLAELVLAAELRDPVLIADIARELQRLYREAISR